MDLDTTEEEGISFLAAKESAKEYIKEYVKDPAVIAAKESANDFLDEFLYGDLNVGNKYLFL